MVSLPSCFDTQDYKRIWYAKGILEALLFADKQLHQSCPARTRGLAYVALAARAGHIILRQTLVDDCSLIILKGSILVEGTRKKSSENAA